MKIPIVFSFDDNFALPASIAIRSLIESKKPETEYDIFILYDSKLQERTKSLIDRICPIKWILVDDTQFKDVPLQKNWNRNTYYRLIVPRLFSEYEKIIWSDVDVLFKGDLSDVYSMPIVGFDWGGVAAEVNDSSIVCHTFRPENQNPFIYWPGFMIYNIPRWRETNLVCRCFSVIEKYGSTLKFCDLDVLNLATTDIKPLPVEYCVLETVADWPNIECAPEYPWLSRVYTKEKLIAARANPKIIHYAGINPKVWNRRRFEIPDYYWDEIVKSPFFRMEFYFPTLWTKLKSAAFFVAYKCAFCKKRREALKKKWRGVKCVNQYQKSQLGRHLP